MIDDRFNGEMTITDSELDEDDDEDKRTTHGGSHRSDTMIELA